MEARQDWLERRRAGIGASDAASVIGLSPYRSNVQLWREKTGREASKDISGLPYVQYGIQAEEHLRNLFALDYPQYSVKYTPYEIIKNSEHPFILATLDGELLDGKRHGVLEIKTSTILSPAQWQQWKGRIPDHYYAQVCHQLLATGYEFSVLKAQLKYGDGASVRHYFFEREAMVDDLAYLLNAELDFWKYVTDDIEPPLVLPAI